MTETALTPVTASGPHNWANNNGRVYHFKHGWIALDHEAAGEALPVEHSAAIHEAMQRPNGRFTARSKVRFKSPKTGKVMDGTVEGDQMGTDKYIVADEKNSTLEHGPISPANIVGGDPTTRHPLPPGAGRTQVGKRRERRSVVAAGEPALMPIAASAGDGVHHYKHGWIPLDGIALRTPKAPDTKPGRMDVYVDGQVGGSIEKRTRSGSHIRGPVGNISMGRTPDRTEWRAILPGQRTVDAQSFKTRKEATAYVAAEHKASIGSSPMTPGSEPSPTYGKQVTGVGPDGKPISGISKGETPDGRVRVMGTGGTDRYVPAGQVQVAQPADPGPGGSADRYSEQARSHHEADAMRKDAKTRSGLTPDTRGLESPQTPALAPGEPGGVHPSLLPGNVAPFGPPPTDSHGIGRDAAVATSKSARDVQPGDVVAHPHTGEPVKVTQSIPRRSSSGTTYQAINGTTRDGTPTALPAVGRNEEVRMHQDHGAGGPGAPSAPGAAGAHQPGDRVTLPNGKTGEVVNNVTQPDGSTWSLVRSEDGAHGLYPQGDLNRTDAGATANIVPPDGAAKFAPQDANPQPGQYSISTKRTGAGPGQEGTPVHQAVQHVDAGNGDTVPQAVGPERPTQAQAIADAHAHAGAPGGATPAAPESPPAGGEPSSPEAPAPTDRTGQWVETPHGTGQVTSTYTDPNGDTSHTVRYSGGKGQQSTKQSVNERDIKPLGGAGPSSPDAGSARLAALSPDAQAAVRRLAEAKQALDKAGGPSGHEAISSPEGRNFQHAWNQYSRYPLNDPNAPDGSEAGGNIHARAGRVLDQLGLGSSGEAAAPEVPAAPGPFGSKGQRPDRMQAMIDSAKVGRNPDQPTVHLQGIGKHPAKPVGEFKPGDKVVYNYGETGHVVKNEDLGNGRHRMTTSEKGKEYTNTRKSTTLLGHRPGEAPAGPPATPGEGGAPQLPEGAQIGTTRITRGGRSSGKDRAVMVRNADGSVTDSSGYTYGAQSATAQRFQPMPDQTIRPTDSKAMHRLVKIANDRSTPTPEVRAADPNKPMADQVDKMGPAERKFREDAGAVDPNAPATGLEAKYGTPGPGGRPTGDLSGPQPGPSDLPMGQPVVFRDDQGNLRMGRVAGVARNDGVHIRDTEGTNHAIKFQNVRRVTMGDYQRDSGLTPDEIAGSTPSGPTPADMGELPGSERVSVNNLVGFGKGGMAAPMVGTHVVTRDGGGRGGTVSGPPHPAADGGLEVPIKWDDQRNTPSTDPTGGTSTPEAERQGLRDRVDAVRSPSGRSAKMQRAFRAAEEGDKQWLNDHGISVGPDDKIHVSDNHSTISAERSNGKFIHYQINGNGQGSPRQWATNPPDLRLVHDPGDGGVPNDTTGASHGGEAEVQQLRDRVSKAATGRSAKQQRAFTAAEQGDHAWLAAHGFSAQPGQPIHVNDQGSQIAVGQPDGTHIIHSVNGNGVASSTSNPLPADDPLIRGMRQVGTAEGNGPLASDRNATGRPTSEGLVRQPGQSPLDSLKGTRTVNDRGTSNAIEGKSDEELRQIVAGHPDTRTRLAATAELTRRRNAPSTPGASNAGAEANRVGGETTAYDPTPPRTVNGMDLQAGDIFKMAKKRFLNTGESYTPKDAETAVYRAIDGGHMGNGGDPTYVRIDPTTGEPIGRPVKMMGLYTTAQVIGKERGTGPKALAAEAADTGWERVPERYTPDGYGIEVKPGAGPGGRDLHRAVFPDGSHGPDRTRLMDANKDVDKHVGKPTIYRPIGSTGPKAPAPPRG